MSLDSDHAHVFIVRVDDIGYSAGVSAKCDYCEERRYFRVTTRKAALKEFAERGVSS